MPYYQQNFHMSNKWSRQRRYQQQYEQPFPMLHYPYNIHPQGMHAPSQLQQPYSYFSPEYGPMQNINVKKANHLFHNPLQPDDGYMYEKYMSNGSQQINNAYPKAPLTPKITGTTTGSLLNSFKTQEGSLDFNKMVNTAGQLFNAINQVSSMAKGIGGIFKL